MASEVEALFSKLFAVGGSCFGLMLIGLGIAWTGSLPPAAGKGVSLIYSKLVFPMMVFRGVAAIKLGGVDTSLLLVMVLSKASMAAIVVLFGYLMLRHSHGARALAHAAAYGMAASHSFDVTLGAPIASVMFPHLKQYLFLNQSMQVIFVNPVLLMLMEVCSPNDGGGGGGVISGARRVAWRLATTPLIIMTILGLLASVFFPAGLPPLLAEITKQITGAGPFLGFMSLGFAMASLGDTTSVELQHCLVLNGCKLVGLPCLYLLSARLLGCPAPPEFLVFLGTLPATASVYSLTLTRGLSPRVVGPLVPLSMLLSVTLSLLPFWPAAEAVHGAFWLRVAVALVALGGVAGSARLCMSAGDTPGAKQD